MRKPDPKARLIKQRSRKKSKQSDVSYKNGIRRLKGPKKIWHKPKTWFITVPLPPSRPISPTIDLLKQTIGLIKKAWKPILGVTIVYMIGVFVFVRSFTISNETLDLTRELIEESGSNGLISKFGDSAKQLTAVIADANSSFSAASGVYQIILLTICSLALIWIFRMALSNEKAGVKSSFYEGMNPLIKYLLVLLMLGVHLLPMAICGYIYNLVLSSGILMGAEHVLAAAVFILCTLWTLRLVTHSAFALFIVTLPDVLPLEALRSAKRMVLKRRLLIWRKIVFAMFIVIFVMLLILTPFIIFAPTVAGWVVFVLSTVLLPLVQAFLYVLYREII